MVFKLLENRKIKKNLIRKLKEQGVKEVHLSDHLIMVATEMHKSNIDYEVQIYFGHNKTRDSMIVGTRLPENIDRLRDIYNKENEEWKRMDERHYQALQMHKRFLPHNTLSSRSPEGLRVPAFGEIKSI